MSDAVVFVFGYSMAPYKLSYNNNYNNSNCNYNNSNCNYYYLLLLSDKSEHICHRVIVSAHWQIGAECLHSLLPLLLVTFAVT